MTSFGATHPLSKTGGWRLHLLTLREIGAGRRASGDLATIDAWLEVG